VVTTKTQFILELLPKKTNWETLSKTVDKVILQLTSRGVSEENLVYEDGGRLPRNKILPTTLSPVSLLEGLASILGVTQQLSFLSSIFYLVPFFLSSVLSFFLPSFIFLLYFFIYLVA
jgi:hypothetical protein